MNEPLGRVQVHCLFGYVTMDVACYRVVCVQRLLGTADTFTSNPCIHVYNSINSGNLFTIIPSHRLDSPVCTSQYVSALTGPILLVQLV